MSRTGSENQKSFFVLPLDTAEQVRTTQLFNLNRSNLNLLLPDVPLMTYRVLLFKLIEEMRQWRIEDLEKRGHNRGCRGKAPSRRRLGGSGGYVPSRQRILRFSRKKNTHFSSLFYRKWACSECSHYNIDNAKIFLQLLSKSRSSGKISEKRLQPSSV